MARPSQSLLPRTLLLLAVLALSIPALVAASSPVQQQHQHAHQLQQRQQHHGHANGPLAHQRRDMPYNDSSDYHRMRLMPRQSNAAAGGDGGSSEDDSGAGSPLSSGRGAITPSNNGANGNTGGSNDQASNTANLPVASNTNVANTASASNAAGSAAPSQTTPGGLLGNLGSGISSALNQGVSSSTSDSALLPSSTSETIPPTTSDTTSADVQTTVDPNLAASSSSTDAVDNITLTQTVSASEPASDTSVPEETAAASTEKKESSGISKSAVIIIIVVASCVGGAIAIWTIIRKIKLSPSSRFNRKLSPIDFSANRRDSDYFDTLGSVDNLAKTANGGGSPPNGMISDKDDIDSWPLHHSPSQSSNGHQHHDRQDSNEKIGGGMYGSIAPALPPSSSVSGSIRRNPTMTSSHSNGALGMGMGLNRADSMASSAHGGGARSDSGHQQQQYQGFYPAMPPPPPPSQVVGQHYNNPTYHQGYAPQYQQHNNALDYSQSMRRPGGYEY